MESHAARVISFREGWEYFSGCRFWRSDEGHFMVVLLPPSPYWRDDGFALLYDGSIIKLKPGYLSATGEAKYKANDFWFSKMPGV